jgi:hypothetical protein
VVLCSACADSAGILRACTFTRDGTISRSQPQDGIEAPFDPVTKEWRYDLADLNARVRKILNQLNDRPNGQNGGAQ